ncbi:MAG: LysR family transcriptional regulator [Opitutales bacterium]|nr:LysR family transcriptional regulator [Opitutales bacterium]
MANELETRQLRLFVELAERGHMGHAAKALSLTPSALSHALKRLEADLGCTLFDRRGRGLHLTVAGRLFQTEAKSLLENIEHTAQRFRQRLDWRQGRLRIGSTSAGCNFLLPSVIREFRDSFPQVSLRLTEGTPEELITALNRGELDFAVCVQDRQTRDLEQTPLVEEKLVFLVHPLHPWATSGRVVRAEITAQRFILSETDSDAFRLIEAYFRSERIQIEPFIEVRGEMLIKKLVDLDLGVALLPEWIAREEIRDGRLRAFPPGRRALRRNWVLLRPRGRPEAFAETLFLGLLEMVARHLIA